MAEYFRAHIEVRRAKPCAKSIFSALFQLRGNFWRRWHGHADRRVSMESILARGNVELHKVAGTKGAIARNAVNHFIVHADAIHARKSMHKLRRRLRAMVRKISAADRIELASGHAETHFARHDIQRAGYNPPDGLQFLQFILSGNGHRETLDAALILANNLQ